MHSVTFSKAFLSLSPNNTIKKKKKTGKEHLKQKKLLSQTVLLSEHANHRERMEKTSTNCVLTNC